jgi:hypothetical protein
MRIDSSGNLLVGKTGANSNLTGVQAISDGRFFATTSGSYALVGNRLSSDGDIALFQRDGITVGSIGSTNFNGGKPFIANPQSSGAGLGFYTNAIFPTNSSGAPSNGVVDLGIATYYKFKDLHLSGGVVFGATGGSVTSKTLDDYEEGIFTPVLTTDGTAPSFTYAHQKGYYTKVGDLVNVYIYFSISALGSAGTGNAKITGLPFTSNANIQGGLSNNWSSVAWATNCPEAAHIPVSSTEALPVFINGAATSRITSSNFDAGFECILHGSYKTA